MKNEFISIYINNRFVPFLKSITNFNEQQFNIIYTSALFCISSLLFTSNQIDPNLILFCNENFDKIEHDLNIKEYAIQLLKFATNFPN